MSPSTSPSFATAAWEQRARAHTNPTILIAEDSTDSREMMQTLLRLKGYQVLSAENGPNAVEVALAHQPDLILLDLQLPKLDGLGVTKNLRSRREFKNTPIIIISGHDPEWLRGLAIDAGCTDCLLKPIDFQRLDALLNLSVPLPR